MHRHRRFIKLVPFRGRFHPLLSHEGDVAHNRHAKLPNDVLRLAEGAVSHFDQVTDRQSRKRSQKCTHSEKPFHDR